MVDVESESIRKVLLKKKPKSTRSRSPAPQLKPTPLALSWMLLHDRGTILLLLLLLAFTFVRGHVQVTNGQTGSASHRRQHGHDESHKKEERSIPRDFDTGNPLTPPAFPVSFRAEIEQRRGKGRCARLPCPWCNCTFIGV